jgi:hypothetical protein
VLFVPLRDAELTLVAVKVPENEPVVAVMVLSVNAGVDKDAIEALVTANCPVLILDVASSVVVVIPVEATAVDTFNVPVLKAVDTTLVTVLFVPLRDAELTLVAVKVPENEPEVAVTVLSVNAGVDKDAIEALVTANCPVLILVVASKVPVVIPIDATALFKFNVPVLKAVDTTLVIVALDAPNDPAETSEPTNVPVLIVDEILAPPETSKAVVGDVVLIPVLPPRGFKHRFKNDKFLLADIQPISFVESAPKYKDAVVKPFEDRI